MGIANKKICPSCAKSIPATAILCNFCENDLRSDYSIIPDGLNFGIAFGEEIKVHGLSLESAKRILAIVKSNQNNQARNLDW